MINIVNLIAPPTRRVLNHGAKARTVRADSHIRRDRQSCERLGSMEGRKHPLVHERQLQTDSRPRPVPCRIPQRFRAQHQRVGRPRQRHTSGAPGRSQNLRQQRGNRNLLHHQTHLATVGGGA